MAQIGGFWVSLTRPGRFAMQKVVGSSPIIRLRVPANQHVLFFAWTTMNRTLSRYARWCPSWPPSARTRSWRAHADAACRTAIAVWIL
jgi:hypothetical protein